LKLQEALAINPANDDARYDYAKLLIKAGELEAAQAALAPAMAQIPLQLRFDALHHWLGCFQYVTNDPKGAWTTEQYEAHLAQDKRDFEVRLGFARSLVVAQEMTRAMDELLEIVMRDKAWSDQIARRLYVAILELMTPPKPKTNDSEANKSKGGIELAGHVNAQMDPQAELVSRYRRKLSMALN